MITCEKDLVVASFDPFRESAGYHFEEERGQRVINFFENELCHIEGRRQGQPFILEDWQRRIIFNLFGWVNDSGLRRFRVLFLYVPRKNGKSTFIGGLINYVYFEDGEKGAQIYAAAGKRDQAGAIYRPVRGMMSYNFSLEYQVKENKNLKRISLLSDPAHFFQLVTSDASTEHGSNAQMISLDEIHALKSRELYDVLDTSTASRDQPIITLTTTADYFRESFCNEELQYARDVRDAIIDDPYYLPIIYEASRDEDWHSEETWRKANPNYGTSLNPDYFKKQHLKAVTNPSFENTFKRLHLNIQTEQLDRWLPMDHYEQCTKTFEAKEMVGKLCYGAFDISSTDDITAFDLFFPDLFAVLTWMWIPEDNIGRFEKYKAWVKKGYLRTCPGNAIDIKNVVKPAIFNICDTYSPQRIGFDQWQGAHLGLEMVEMGYNMIKVPQNFGTLSLPSKEFYKMVLRHDLRHNNHPILRWMAGNLSVKEGTYADTILPIKKNKFGKIDGIMALIMAISCWLMDFQETDSYYEENTAEVF